MVLETKNSKIDYYRLLGVGLNYIILNQWQKGMRELLYLNTTG